MVFAKLLQFSCVHNGRICFLKVAASVVPKLLAKLGSRDTSGSSGESGQKQQLQRGYQQRRQQLYCQQGWRQWCQCDHNNNYSNNCNICSQTFSHFQLLWQRLLHRQILCRRRRTVSLRSFLCISSIIALSYACYLGFLQFLLFFLVFLLHPLSCLEDIFSSKLPYLRTKLLLCLLALQLHRYQPLSPTGFLLLFVIVVFVCWDACIFILQCPVDLLLYDDDQLLFLVAPLNACNRHK